jgi:hypothetical protein
MYGLCLSLAQQQIPFSSIFEGAEGAMNSSHVMGCLKYIARRKDMDRYHSVVDFLFCELFPIYKPGCFRFYADEGPQLREIIDEEQILFYDNQLLKALTLAVEIGKEEWRHPTTQRKVNWTSFRSLFSEAA